MIDLWPEDTPSHTSLKAPVVILREQGALLSKKTSNLVEGLVSRDEDPFLSDNTFRYQFYLVAPALSNYRYRLLTILHSIDLYPLKIQTDADIFEELPAEVKDEHDELLDIPQDRFMDVLKAIFATKKVKKVIEAMIAQSVGE